jgi:hypothetical protein
MGRWVRRPEGSTWGDFGPDDQLGRMNLLTPERRLAAVAEVKAGLCFALSLPLDFPGGSGLTEGMRHPPRLFAGEIQGVPSYNTALADSFPGSRDITSDDGVILFTQYSTQWDSLAHWGGVFDADGDGVPEKVYYNGFRAGIDVLDPDQPGGPAARALGLDRLAAAGAQGRGTLVNLRAAYGDGPERIGYDRLMRAIDAQGAEVRPGDFLLLYCGFDEAVLAMDRQPDVAALRRRGAALDGRDGRLLQWITDSQIVAICSDNLAIEATDEFGAPSPDGCSYSLLPLHEHCLFKLGVHLGELWLLRDLAAWLQENRRSSFLLTAPPLRLPGIVGSPVTPVATV